MSTDTTLERSGQAATALGNPAEPNQEIQTSTVGADGTAPQPTSVQLGVDPNEPVIPSDEVISRETFIPVTKFALLDRLTRPQAWDAGEATDARRFFRYLAYWRQQQYNTAVMKLDHAYEPFSPDSDLLMTRQYTDGERAAMQSRVVAGMRHMLQQANYTCIDRSEAELILTSDSHYGLDFDVDLNAFEELEIYYRGASTKKDQKRTFRKFFRKEEFDVPIFQRLFILFKLKSEEQRIEEYRSCVKK